MTHNPEFTKDYVNQLAQAVVSTRIRGGIPNNFTFNPNSGKLLFLSSNFTSNLYYVNLEDINNNTTAEIETLSPQLVLRSDALGGDNHKFSKEEQLLRERQRLTETGITTYFPTDNGEKILIPIGNQLCIAERKEKENHFVMEHVFQSNGAMDPKWSHDGNLISFVRNDDIWILDLTSKAEHQITTVHAEDNLRSAGSSKFIMQEEFDRYTGYWWSPVGDKEYNVLYLVEDEEGVSLFGIPRPGYSGEIDNYSYPLAGEKNTTFEVWVATFSLSSSSSSSSSISVKRTNIFPQLQESFSWRYCKSRMDAFRKKRLGSIG